MSYNTDFFIMAIENEFQLDKEFNIKKSSFFKVFRPNTNKINIKYVLFFFASLFTIFLVPFIPRFNNISSNDEVSGDLFFVISKKSSNMFKEHNSNSKFGRLDTSDFKFRLSEIQLYYKLMFLFFKKFKFNFWFYPELLLLPEMITVYRVLSCKGINSVSMTNQYDRWAIFIGLIAESKRLKLKLHQHGLLDPSYQPKYKIPYLQELYCFNENELGIFSSKIINLINVHIIIPPVLTLSKKVCGISVFLAGTSDISNLPLELNLLNRISELHGVTIFFKAHPLIDIELYRESLSNVVIIRESDNFPTVDYLIHAGSTLALEYENSSSSVIAINTLVISDTDVILSYITESLQ